MTGKVQSVLAGSYPATSTTDYHDSIILNFEGMVGDGHHACALVLASKPGQPIFHMLFIRVD